MPHWNRTVRCASCSLHKTGKSFSSFYGSSMHLTCAFGTLTYLFQPLEVVRKSIAFRWLIATGSIIATDRLPPIYYPMTFLLERQA